MINVKELRLSLGVSRAEFADAVGASPALVQSWELGRRPPSGVAARCLRCCNASRSCLTNCGTKGLSMLVLNTSGKSDMAVVPMSYSPVDSAERISRRS